MRSRGSSFLIVVMIIATLTSVGAVASSVDANIASVQYVSDGLMLTSNDGVQMPMANVSIKAVVTGSFVYDISVECSFELFAEEAVNCTVAFVFPEAWVQGDTGSGTIDQDIYVDSVKVNQLLIEWEELPPDLQTNVTQVEYFEQCSYAVFNTTFGENQTRTVEVDATLYIVSTTELFMFSYAVGSGKYWDGQTMEYVTIEVDDQAGLLSLSFSPHPDSLENVSATVRVAAWCIDVDDFMEFWVRFYAQQKEYGGSFVHVELIALVAAASLVVIVSVVWLVRRR